jgi:hypothetical protein
MFECISFKGFQHRVQKDTMSGDPFGNPRFSFPGSEETCVNLIQCCISEKKVAGVGSGCQK